MIIQDLQTNYERLLEQYTCNLEGVLTLQATLIRDIFPSVKDELDLSPQATEWAKEWLEDTCSIFRICRRNEFTKSFAMESIRKNLVWRLNNMWMLDPPRPTPNLRCLPNSVHDPFGRPILVIETFERLRCHLKCLNDVRSRSPVLQYVILLDLKSLSFKDFNIELLSWTLREIVPRFPGMLAGVFMLNYSWAHSGLWNLIKRVLPHSALSRVFFPTQEELLQYFRPSFLPKDYGGNLPALADLNDPLWSNETPLPRPSQSHDLPPAHSTNTSLSPTSSRNPFFGYPASSQQGLVSLQYGRRRKRDFARTLALLYWSRWRKYLVGLLLAVCACMVKLAAKRRLLHFLKRALGWQALLPSRISH